MIRHLLSIGLAGLLLGAVTGPVRAQDKGAGQLAVTGSVQAGAQAVDEVARSSKFTEYRDVPRGFFLDALRLDLAKGDRYAYVAAFRVQQADALARAGLGQYGTFRLDLEYRETPHRFSFDGATPYVERTPGIFTLNDVIRSAAQALVPTGTGNNIAAARALVSSFLASAAPINLGLERKKMSAGAAWTPTVPWRLELAASAETRNGNRPYGASLGFNNAIELPEPIHYRTTNADASLEYHRAWGTVRAGLAASFFDNEVQTLVWDNPYRITDSTYGQAYVNGNGTAHGRLALPASNDVLRFYLSGSFKPLRTTRVSTAVSYAAFRQNEKLLPFTINTALPASDPAAANALGAPRETALAKAGVASFDLTVRSRLTRSLRLTAGFREYDFNNRTTPLDLPDGYARLDQVWEAIPVAIEPHSFNRSRLFGSLSYDLGRKTTVEAGYAVSRVRRRDGAGEAERDVNNEGIFKAAVDSHPADWLELRLAYLNARRDWSLDGTFVAYIQGFNFKRYFEASRDRQSIDALVGLAPWDGFDIQLSYAMGRDDYPHSSYGLTKDDFDTYGVDATYALAKGISVFAFYVHELYRTDQADRQSGASFSQNPADDWTARLRDKVNTFGAGQSVEIVEDRLRFDMTASYSRAKGGSSLFSPPGGTPDAAVNFTRPLDATAWRVLQASVKWKLTERLAFLAGYWFEDYDLNDIVRNDIAVDYASAGAIFLGALEPGYRYHVGSVRLVYAW